MKHAMFLRHERDLARGYEPYPFAHCLARPTNWKRVRMNLIGLAVIAVFCAAIAEMVVW